LAGVERTLRATARRCQDFCVNVPAG
jgi:hypothetical protein